ncbi:hypothetical protein HZA44_02545 [Candidatus Peregrinibacteria bacterium]|nr:hypothetical protein [Candidatus Peregrinibacteria bacterium]
MQRRVYYRTVADLVPLVQASKKRDVEPVDLVIEACKRHHLEDLGHLTDLNDTWIDIDRKRFSLEKEVAQQLFDAQVYTDLLSKNPVRICGKKEGDRLTKVVALNLIFAEDALMLAKSG